MARLFLQLMMCPVAILKNNILVRLFRLPGMAHSALTTSFSFI